MTTNHCDSQLSIAIFDSASCLGKLQVNMWLSTIMFTSYWLPLLLAATLTCCHASWLPLVIK